MSLLLAGLSGCAVILDVDLSYSMDRPMILTATCVVLGAVVGFAVGLLFRRALLGAAVALVVCLCCAPIVYKGLATGLH